MSANYTKPTSQLDYEERTKKDYTPPGVLGKGVDPAPSDTGFVNVDPIYQNFANETEKPLAAEKGVEKKLEETVYAENADFDFGAAEDGEASDDEDDKEPTGSGATTSASSTTGAPAPSGGNTPPSNS